MTLRWYKHFPSDFIEGVAFLTLEECGAFILVLDALYACDGSMPDDDAALARLWRCNARKARRLKGRLLDRGKIQTDNGLLTNRRVTFELNKAKTKSMFAQLSARKRWNNNGPRHANGYAIPDTRYKKEGKPMEDTPRVRTEPIPTTPQLKQLEQSRGRKW